MPILVDALLGGLVGLALGVYGFIGLFGPQRKATRGAILFFSGLTLFTVSAICFGLFS